VNSIYCRSLVSFLLKSLIVSECLDFDSLVHLGAYLKHCVGCTLNSCIYSGGVSVRDCKRVDRIF
jgi:hypothetical protein